MSSRLFIAVTLLLTLACPEVGVGVIRAETPAKPPKKAAARKAVSSTLTDKQQLAALDFAEEHHSQLAGLIRKLRQQDPAEHKKALTSLSKTAERLARLKTRDEERHAVDLALWKVDSRIRLLAARMVGRASRHKRSRSENPLRALLNERTDLRLKQISLEKDRLESRLAKLADQASDLAANREAIIDKEVDRLVKSVHSKSVKVAKKAKVAKKPSPKETPAKKTKSSPDQAPREDN